MKKLVTGVTIASLLTIAGLLAWFWLLNAMWSQCPVDDEGIANGWTILGNGSRVAAALFMASLLVYLAFAAVVRGTTVYLTVAAPMLVAVAVAITAVSLTYTPVIHDGQASQSCPSGTPSWWRFPTRDAVHYR